MPRWEHCSKCGEAYNPNKFTAEQRLLQAIFGENLCPKCFATKGSSICVECNKDVSELVYYNEESYHSICLAEVLGQ